MTISTEVRKAGPFIGNGSASSFPFAFKVFKASDLIVVRRQDNIGVETTLVLDSDYHVTLNVNQDTTPGGVVALTGGALADGFTLIVSSELPYLQTTDLTNQGGFYPKVITNALDRLTIFCQQLAENLGRTLKLPITAPTNISTEIPLPNPSELIAWDETGTKLTTVSPQSLVTSIAYGSATADLFAGDGVTTTFPLTTNPASVNNLDVSIGGYSQRPVQDGVGDYSWNGGASITFVTPPPAPTVPGDKNVLVRYMQAIPVSDSEALHAQTREALRRSYAEAGSNLIDGSFETGGTLTAAADALLQESTGAAYGWTGALPKVVAPGFDPVGVVGFELRASATLRGGLSEIDGSDLIGVATYANIRTYTGTATRIRCLGRENLFDGASGDFALDQSDTTSADNDITILVDANGGRWKRQYSGRAFGEWAGIKADDATADDAALQKLLTFACAGNPVSLVSKPGIVRLFAPVSTTLLDNKFVDIDFNGAVIKPVDGYVAGTSDKLMQLNGGESLLSGCSVHIKNPQFDSSNITPVNATTLAARKGIGGLLVQAAHSVKVENSRANGQFYSASIFVNVFNRLDVDGHYGVDCGVKYNATADDVSVGDAAGDSIYTANAVGDAQVSLRNVKSSGQAGLVGRAGFVSESGGAATSITVTFDNVSFDGYQRITHQEDGGKSTIEWNGGKVSRFSVMNFTLGATKKRGIKVKNVSAPDVNPPFGYGGKSGVYAGDSQNQAGAPFASYEECDIGYSAPVEERYGAEYVRSQITVGPSVAITKVATNDRYIDCDFNFVNSASRIYYSNNSEVLISGGTSTCSTVNKTAWDLAGGFMRIDNGHKSKYCLPNVSGGTGVSHYEGVYDVGDGSGVSGEIFIGSSHVREFVDAKIIGPSTGFIELKGNAGCVNKLLEDVITEGVVINYDTHSTFATRATTRDLTQRFAVGNTPSVPFQYSNGPQVVHVGYVLDRANETVATPASAGNIKYVASTVVKTDGSTVSIV